MVWKPLHHPMIQDGYLISDHYFVISSDGKNVTTAIAKSNLQKV